MDADHTGGNDKLAAAGAFYVGGCIGPGCELHRLDTLAPVIAYENVLNRMSTPAAGQTARPAQAWPTDTYHREFYKLTSYFNGEPVVVYHEPAAHTDGDSIVYFRHSEVISAGNLLLAVFNLFPGYPLDGDRVLRAIIWKRSGNINDATRVAGFCGQLIAAVLIVFGLYMAFAPSFRAYFMGFWSVLVGLFLLSAATSVIKSAGAKEPATVAEAMAAPVPLEPDLPINRFVDEILSLHRHTSFPVAQDKQLLGILTLEDLKKVPREEWRSRRVRDVMKPVTSQLFVPHNATMGSAKELMQQNGVGALAIVNGAGDLVGFLRSGRLKRQKK